MEDEEVLIRSVLAAPRDPLPKEAYADWLDERRDPRGEFIRLRLALSELPCHSAEAKGLQSQIRERARKLPGKWLQRLDWVTMTTGEALDELQLELPGVNYDIDFEFHRIPAIPGATAEQYLAEALPNAMLVDAVATDAGAMLARVEQCIRWKGDDGSPSHRQFHRSRRWNDLVRCLRSHLEQAAGGSAQIWELSYWAGHPYYPFQWQFAYLIVRSDAGEIFIGTHFGIGQGAGR